MKIQIVRYVKTEKGWVRRNVKAPTKKTKGWETRLDASLDAYGADVVALGDYQLRWYKDGRIHHKKVGREYTKADQALAQHVRELRAEEAARDAGRTLAPEPEEEEDESGNIDKGPLLKNSIEAFLDSRRAVDKITSETTGRKYHTLIKDFLAMAKVRYAREVTRGHLESFLISMKKPATERRRGRGRQRPENGLSQNTRRNYFARIVAFLEWADPEHIGPLVKKMPRIRKVAPTPKSYDIEKVYMLIEFLRDRNRKGDTALALAAEMLLKTGVRRNELAHLAWGEQVDLDTGFVSIRTDRTFHLQIGAKMTTRKFETKTRRDRTMRIPLDEALVARLRHWREVQIGAAPVKRGSRFLFPNRAGNPDTLLLKRIKIAAYQAGLACGECDPCQRPCRDCRHCRCRKCKACRIGGNYCTNPNFHGAEPCLHVLCEKWTLHKFRHTFATTLLQSKKIDLITLRDLLGHTSVATTEIYTAAVKEQQAQQEMRGIFS